MIKNTLNPDYMTDRLSGDWQDSYARDVAVYEHNGLVMVIVYNYEKDGIRSISITGDLKWCHLKVNIEDTYSNGCPVIRPVLDTDLSYASPTELDGIAYSLNELKETQQYFEDILANLYRN